MNQNAVAGKAFHRNFHMSSAVWTRFENLLRMATWALALVAFITSANVDNPSALVPIIFAVSK